MPEPINFLKEMIEDTVPEEERCGVPHPEDKNITCQLRKGHEEEKWSHIGGKMSSLCDWDTDLHTDRLEGQPRPTKEQVAWVFAHLYDHLNNTGTYRVLIYRRLGFLHDAYTPLLMAGGMELSNAFFELQEYQEKYGQLSTESCPVVEKS